MFYFRKVWKERMSPFSTFLDEFLEQKHVITWFQSLITTDGDDLALPLPFYCSIWVTSPLPTQTHIYPKPYRLNICYCFLNFSEQPPIFGGRYDLVSGNHLSNPRCEGDSRQVSLEVYSSWTSIWDEWNDGKKKALYFIISSSPSDPPCPPPPPVLASYQLLETLQSQQSAISQDKLVFTLKQVLVFSSQCIDNYVWFVQFAALSQEADLHQRHQSLPTGLAPEVGQCIVIRGWGDHG